MNIKAIEELSMNAWPSLQTKLYDGWVLRFAEGYTKRCNSVNPIYESAIQLDEKIDFCERQYRSCNLPTVFKVTNESCPKGIDKRLEERGYAKVDETSIRVLKLSKYSCREPEEVVVDDQFCEIWIEGYFSCSKLYDK